MPEIPPVHAAADDSPFQLSVTGHRTLLQIKSWLPEHIAGKQPLNIGGQELPCEVGSTSPPPLHVLCLAPGDWLLASSGAWLASFNRHVAPELPEQGLAVLDVTDGFAMLKVGGRAAREVLAKGCGLDLHPQAFPAGRCARTRFAQISVIIDCVDDSSKFDIYVGRSYLRYLGDWLEDAAVEFMSSPYDRTRSQLHPDPFMS